MGFCYPAALRSAEANEWPFDADWDDWLPDEEWGIPELAPRWSDPSVGEATGVSLAPPTR